MEICAFDIETIPNQELPEGTIPQFDESDVKLGNTKDPVKVEAKVSKARQDFKDGLSKKMSLDPDLCQIVMFSGIKYDTEKGQPIQETIKIDDTMEDEHSLLLDGWQFIRNAYNNRIPLVSFNGIKFDLVVMLHRAMGLDVPLSTAMYAALTPRWTAQHHYDLMQILAGWDRNRWKSLEFYLNRFGLGSKQGMDGSQVYPLWQKREFDKIKEYGRHDALMTCELFERIEPWIFIELTEGG